MTRRPPPLFVVCNGGYRTGSTVAYNIVREILALRGMPYTGGLRSEPGEVDAAADAFPEGRDWVVLKSHVWAPSTAVPWMRVIYTTRDYFDVAASLVRHRESWDAVEADLQWQVEMDVRHRNPLFVELYRPLILAYDYYWHRPGERVDMIGRHIGVKLSRSEVIHVLNRTSVDRAVAVQETLVDQGQDPDTLIQAGHVGAHRGQPGYGRTTLGAQGIACVETALQAVGMAA
jgi:hypothetical protein